MTLPQVSQGYPLQPKNGQAFRADLRSLSPKQLSENILNAVRQGNESEVGRLLQFKPSLVFETERYITGPGFFEQLPLATMAEYYIQRDLAKKIALFIATPIGARVWEKPELSDNTTQEMTKPCRASLLLCQNETPQLVSDFRIAAKKSHKRRPGLVKKHTEPVERRVAHRPRHSQESGLQRGINHIAHERR